jgi:protein transport protein SEC61 subunit gamma-like protein
MELDDIPGQATDLKRKLTDRLREYRRVLKISEKPDREEFIMSAKVTSIGMLLIGTIGFLFYLAANLIPQYL